MKTLRNIFLSLQFMFLMQFSFAEGIQFFNNFVSSSWNFEDGLPGNSVTDIVQDTKGYIYIGTYEGLVRFDGIEFTVINKGFDKKYDFVSVRSLFIDSRGNLWNGSNDEGVFCIGKDDRVRKFTTADGLPNNSIRALCEDNEGNIWVGTSSGIALISPSYEVFIPEGVDELGEENNILVKNLFCDSVGRIWICTALKNRLYVYSGHHFSVYGGITSVENPSVNYVVQDSAGAFWFGVSPYYLLKKNGEEETLFDIGGISQKGTVVNCIFHDSAGNVWFSTDTGLGVLSGGEISYYTEKQGLVDDKVVKILEDRESNIWIGTDRGGIEKLSQSQFRVIKNNETINAVAEDTFRKVFWFASDKGVRCFDQKNFVENPLTKYCENVRVRDVFITDAGDVIVSTYAQLGLVKYGLDGKITSWTTDDGLTGNRTRCSLLHSDGDLYIATTNGLNIVKGFSKSGEIARIQKNSVITSDFIMALYEDSEGNVWCGTDGGGVFVVDSETYEIKKVYTTENGLVGNIVFKISEPVPGQKWICTGTGLSVLKENDGSVKIYNFNSSNGLGADGVFQALIDYTETVWFTCNKGIFSVHYRDFEKVFNGKSDSVFSKFYGRSDGIITSGITSTSKSAKDSFGRLWFTLVDGVAFYDPVRSRANTKAPVVQIQEISIDDETFVYDGSPVEIGPASKRLSIKFTGLSFISSEQVKFSYKLEGYDSKFSEWTTQRNVSYTNLPHGTYKFTVIAMTRDEVKSLPSEAVTVIKRSYIWNLFWFKFFVGGIIVLTTAALIFHRYKVIVREQKRNKEFTSQVISALVVAIDAKDQYTKGHSNRVSKYAVMIARKAGKSEAELERIFYAGLLHDVGKIGVPDSIISKPDKLTDEEFEVIKTHSVIGSEILKSITAIPEVVVGARWHHERWDGKGYPDGLKGTGIPEVARIIGVADAYDAMTSDRSYRRQLIQSVVREQIEKGRGSQFDPVFATIMLEIIDDDVDFKLHE